MRVIIVVLILGVLMFLSSCAGRIDGRRYVEQTPKFDLQAFFTGPVKAWGIIQERSGNVIKRFDVEMNGSWEGDEGTLEEVFTYYEDAKVQNRTWKIKRLDDTTYEGRAGDILGVAKGKSFGGAINWTYEMDVPVDDTHYRLKFDDWMWAMKDDVVINRSYMKKFGITVAEITLFMQKTAK